MAIDEQKGGLWRPANATEGADFEQRWCRHCRSDEGEDWEDEFGHEINGACVIGESMFWSAEFRSDDLVVRNRRPWCLAFTQDPDKPARCLFTEEMDV